MPSKSTNMGSTVSKSYELPDEQKESKKVKCCCFHCYVKYLLCNGKKCCCLRCGVEDDEPYQPTNHSSTVSQTQGPSKSRRHKTKIDVKVGGNSLIIGDKSVLDKADINVQAGGASMIVKTDERGVAEVQQTGYVRNQRVYPELPAPDQQVRGPDYGY